VVSPYNRAAVEGNRGAGEDTQEGVPDVVVAGVVQDDVRGVVQDDVWGVVQGDVQVDLLSETDPLNC